MKKKKFPKRTLRRIADGSTVATLDTGLVKTIRTTRELHGRISVNECCEDNDPLDTLRKIEQSVRGFIGSKRALPHLYKDARDLMIDKDARDLMIECGLARDLIKSGDIRRACAKCLGVGHRFAMLLVRQAEEVFASGRASMEAARGARNREMSPTWDSIYDEWKLNPRLTTGAAYRIHQHDYPEVTLGNFSKSFKSHIKQWQKEAVVKKRNV